MSETYTYPCELLPFKRTTPHDAELAGYDCGKNGANQTNCRSVFFTSSHLTAAWERGKSRAEKEAVK